MGKLGILPGLGPGVLGSNPSSPIYFKNTNKNNENQKIFELLFLIKCRRKQRNQNQQEDLEQDMEKE